MKAVKYSNRSAGAYSATLRVEPNDSGPGTPAYLFYADLGRRFLLRIGTHLELIAAMRRLGFSDAEIYRVAETAMTGSVAEVSLTVAPASLFALGFEEIIRIA